MPKKPSTPEAAAPFRGNIIRIKRKRIDVMIVTVPSNAPGAANAHATLIAAGYRPESTDYSRDDGTVDVIGHKVENMKVKARK